MKGHSTADADTKKIILEDGGGTEEIECLRNAVDKNCRSVEEVGTREGNREVGGAGDHAGW